MKLIPDNISSVDTKKFKYQNKTFLTVLTESSKYKSDFLFECKEDFDFDVYSTLVEKRAFASAFLFLIENAKFITENQEDAINLKEDVNALLHTNITVLNEQAPLLTTINEYPLFESNKYILRGDGENKIKEYFCEEVDINDYKTDADLEAAEYAERIKGFLVCPYCKNVFEEEGASRWAEAECPYCNKVHMNFHQADLDDLADAPNKYEYIEKTVDESSDLESSEKQAKQMAWYDLDALQHKVDQDFSKDELRNMGVVAGVSVPSAINKIKSYNPKTQNFSTYSASKSALTTVMNYISKLMKVDLKSDEHLEEEAEGTQVSDIAPKTGYSPVLSGINDLDILNKGFLKNKKGQYQRGNYVIVKEGTEYKVKNIKELHESVYEESIKDIQTEFCNTEQDVNFTKACLDLEKKLNELPVGTKIKFRVDNSYHDCINEYEKIDSTNWKLTYSVNDKIAWDTICKDASSDIGNDFMNSDLI